MPLRPLHDFLAVDGRPLSLEEVLEARDRRAALQKQLLGRTRCPLICMTLNLPGRVKRTPLSSFFFDREKSRLLSRLRALGAETAATIRLEEDTGEELLLAVRGFSAPALKSLTLTLEEGSNAARLLDLDVLGRDGRPLERPAPRQCFLCSQPAHLCIVSRAHPAELVQKKVTGLLTSYARESLADLVSGLALEASAFELMVAPKPGLVTPCSAGSHDDMDRFTFIRSQAVLAPYYRRAFSAGWDTLDASRLRLEGMEAESAMERETAGVNTQRGWIYLSGILLAAAGRYCRAILLGEGPGRGPGRDQAARDLMDLAAATARDLEESLEQRPCFVHLLKRLGGQGQDRGIRGEARRGFPSIFQGGVPVLAGALASGEDENTAGLRALLTMLALADDSTLIRRGGSLKAEEIKAELDQALGCEGTSPGQAALALSALDLDLLVKRLGKQFEEEGLTCGGAADLLAGSRLVDRFLRVCAGLCVPGGKTG